MHYIYRDDGTVRPATLTCETGPRVPQVRGLPKVWVLQAQVPAPGNDVLREWRAPVEGEKLHALEATLARDGWHLAVAERHPSADFSGLGNLWLASRNYPPWSPVFPGTFPLFVERSRREVERLFEANQLRVAAPTPFRRPHRRHGWENEDRVAAMILTLAMGDSLGNSSESKRPSERRRVHGRIDGYLPHRHAAHQAVGLPSDDTQLTVWSLESMLDHGTLKLDHLAHVFSSRKIYGIGRTVQAFCDAMRSGSSPWEARQSGAGNGAVMRIAGIFAPHAYFDAAFRPEDQHRRDVVTEATWLWDVLLASALTHDDPTASGCSVGFCAVLEALLRTGSQGGLTGKDVVEIFVDAARPIEGEPKLRSRVPGELYEGPLWRFVEQRVLTALREGKPTSEALGAWYSGAYLLETMPTVLYLVARLLDEPQECLLRAVNDTYDNDTIAALCGAALGARHGFDAFPRPWREGLLGRTGPEDDGHVFTVVDRLKRLGGHLGVPQEAFRKPR